MPLFDLDYRSSARATMLERSLEDLNGFATDSFSCGDVKITKKAVLFLKVFFAPLKLEKFRAFAYVHFRSQKMPFIL